mgnify:CR=1 FL=1
MKVERRERKVRKGRKEKRKRRKEVRRKQREEEDEDDDDDEGKRRREEHEEAEMSAEDAITYRSVVARCNFLSQDRPELLFAVKEASRCMASPRNGDWHQIKRADAS